MSVLYHAFGGIIASPLTPGWGSGNLGDAGVSPFGYKGQYGAYTDHETQHIILDGRAPYVPAAPTYVAPTNLYNGNPYQGGANEEAPDAWVNVPGSQKALYKPYLDAAHQVAGTLGAGLQLAADFNVLCILSEILTGQDASGHCVSMEKRLFDLATPAAGPVLHHLGGLAMDFLGQILKKNCFVAGTPVWVATQDKAGVWQFRTKPLETVQAGEYVIARDEATGVTTPKRVLETTVKLANMTVSVTLVDAQSGRVVETITASREHPFYVEGNGFVPAGQLAIGNSIVTRAGPALVVKSVTWNRRAAGYNVYNFVVEDDHTYFVGKANGGVWVHNVDCYAHAKYYKGVTDDVWNAAKGADGNVIDPGTQQIMDKSADWDMGHLPGYEFRKHAESAEARGLTRREFLNEHNDPKYYRPELPGVNRSHRGESPLNKWPMGPFSPIPRR